MRFTTLNCDGGDIPPKLARLAPLNADLVVLAQCRRLADPSALRDVAASVKVNWAAVSGADGVAVVSLNREVDVKGLAILRQPSSFLPVAVHAAAPFVLVGVSMPMSSSQVETALAAFRLCRAAAAGLPLVLMGDFNASPAVPGHDRIAQRFFTRLGDEFGVVSAYHYCSREAFGTESHRTSRQRGLPERSGHSALILVPDSWAPRVTDVRVGDDAPFPEGDHRPVTLTLRSHTVPRTLNS